MDQTTLEPREVPAAEPAPGQVLARMSADGPDRGEFIAGHGLTKAGVAKSAGAAKYRRVVDHLARRRGERHGGDPTIRYFDLLSLVDNEKGSVTEWAGDGTARDVTPKARRHWRDELNSLLAP